MTTYGICLHTLIAVRVSPSERAEMVTQLLFGETYTILESMGNWTKISTTYDLYEGYVDSKLIQQISEEDLFSIDNHKHIVSQKIIAPLSNITDNQTIPLVAGSSLPLINEDGKFTILGKSYLYKYKTKDHKGNSEQIASYAKQYLNAPYLWGGKTILGIDCSGLTQVIYKLCGIKLPRDASDQVKLGKSVSFVAEAQPGDLAFFDNNEGEIIHVGIIIEPGKIVHASGLVRLDPIDHQGIYNSETSKYSHKLRVIRRIIE